jgi:transcriptional regulator with XRE-family HTH domain
MNLRAARKQRQLTLQQVGHAVGIDAGNLSRIERGQQVPTPALAGRLYAFYEGQVDWPDIFHIEYHSSVA